MCVILVLRLTTPTLHQLVSKPRFFFPTMAKGGRGGGNKHVHMSEVYKHKEATCDDQLTVPFQRLEEKFGQFEQFGEQINAQIGALAEQLAALGGPKRLLPSTKPAFCRRGRQV